MTTIAAEAPGQLTDTPPDSPIEAPADSAGTVPSAFQTVRAVTAVGILQVSVLVVMLLRAKVLALLLKPEGLGIVSTLDQLVQFVAQISALSLIPTPTRFVARAVNDGLAAVTAMYSALLKLLLFSTLAGTVIATGFLFFEPQALGGLAGYRSLALIAVLSAPVFALSGFFANVSAAIRGYATTSLYLLFAAMASLAAAFIGIRAGGIAGLYYGNLIAGGLGVLALARYLHVTAPLTFQMRGTGLRDLIRRQPDILAYCSTSYVLSFAQPLAFLVVRSVMLKRLGPAGAGFFQAAFTISSIASLVLLQAIRIYLEPAVNSATDNRARITAANEFQRTFAVLVLLGTLPLVLFPREAIVALFTRAFTPVSSVVFVFVLADCLFLCNQVYATVLMAVDDFHGFFYTQFAGLVCLCAGVWLLTPHFGLAGVAWSFFISRALVFVLIQALLGAHHGLRMTRRSAAVVAYSLACLAGAAVLAGALSREGLSSILVRIGAFGVVGGATAVFLTKDERMWLAATSRRVLASSRGWVGRGTA